MAFPESPSPAEIERTVDGATLRFERSYGRPRAAVWLALTDSAQLARWLDDATVELRVGGQFVIHFDDGTMSGRITELDPERVLAYSWHEGQFGQSHVRWELTDRSGGGTNLRLTHTRLRTDSAAGFAAGWHHHLERLDGVLGGGAADWSAERFEALHAMYREVSPG